MLLDVRTYPCRPGTIKKHLELYEKMGKEPQFRNLGEPLAYLTTETGNPNQYVHIWVYENAGADWARPAAVAELVDFEPAREKVEQYLRDRVSSSASRKYSGQSHSNG